MKKFLKISGIVLLLFIIAIIALPFMFKGRIKSEIEKAANDNLNATFAFEDVDLSLISNFPNLTVDIEKLSLTGIGTFEGVKLVDAGLITATVDIWSLFGDSLTIREVGIDRANIDVRVLADGSANYDIAKPSTDTTAVEESTEGGGFSMKLKRYFVTNSNISYDDATFPMTLSIKELNHEGSGDFTDDLFLLSTNTTASALDVVYDGVRYIREVKTSLKADFEIDNANSKYTFKDNEIGLNELALKADGWVAMPGDDIDMDITFAALKTEFKTLLSMVPAEFASDLSGVQADGKIAFNGFVRGTYNDIRMPGFGLNLEVNKGRFNYPDMPKSVEDIEIKLAIDASAGIDNDAMTVDIDKFSMTMADNPIDMTLHLKNPYTDPLIDFDMTAKVILDNLKDMIPMENGDRLAGTFDADIHLDGRASAIEEQRFNDFKAEGTMAITGIQFRSDSLAYDVDVNQANFAFNPQFIDMSTFDAKIGKTDIKASGKITDYLNYALKDSMLTGRFNLYSSNMDLNEFMTEEESTVETETETTEEATGVVRLPNNVDFELQSRFDRMIYDDLEITNTSGMVVLRDGVADISNLTMQLLGGTVMMNGEYDSRPDKPLMDMDFNIKNLDINQTAEKFATIDKLAPIAKSCTGLFSTSMHMECTLDESMMPIENTISGAGNLQTSSVYIEKFEPLTKLAEELKIEKLSKQTIQDVNVSYKFEDGKVIVDPFTVKLDGIPAKIEGSMTFSQELDYRMKMDIPGEKLPGNLSNQASSLLSDLNKKLGTNIAAGTKIPVSIRITGTMTDPKIAGNYGEMIQEAKADLKEDLKDAAKEAINEQVDKAKEDAIKKAREEADKLVADAQKQADKAMVDAKKTADSLKEKAYAEAKKVEDSAKNPLEKAGKRLAADTMRKEADKAHAKSIEEAQKQADKIVAQARVEADKKIQQAEGL
ncbi:MAG: AsmA family protein [Cryomorphaceae bacterium]|nr:AsmA family protein [Cryomorphaceae bacterium]